MNCGLSHQTWRGSAFLVLTNSKAGSREEIVKYFKPFIIKCCTCLRFSNLFYKLMTDADVVVVVYKLEDEVEKLLGEQRGLVHSDQALKLSRLMVRAETTDQRIMLLKILQVYLIPQ